MSLQWTVLEDGQGLEQLTLLPADFHASRFPWQATKKEKKTIVTYGLKCAELSENLSRVGYLVKTYLEYCELPVGPFVRIWSTRDILSPYLIMKLRVSERRIKGSESFLWRMPEAEDSANRTFAVDSRGKPKLSAQVKLWPTPTEHGNYNRKGISLRAGNGLATAVKLWPTPTVGAGLCGGSVNYKQLQNLKEQGIITEEERRNMSQGNGGQLNPFWVEWLMGFPIGWTSHRTESPNLKPVFNDYSRLRFEDEPNIPRVIKGCENRKERLKTLGNAVVPHQVYPILQAIAAVEREIDE